MRPEQRGQAAFVLDTSKESSHKAGQGLFLIWLGGWRYCCGAAHWPTAILVCARTSRSLSWCDVLTWLAWRAGWLAGGGRRAQCSDRRGRERQRTEAEGAQRSPEVAARIVDQLGWAVCLGLRLQDERPRWQRSPGGGHVAGVSEPCSIRAGQP